MVALQFIIARHRQTRRWTLEIDRQAHGEYLSEWEALMDAIDLAREATEHGREAEVLFQSASGECRIGWTFGQGSYSKTASRADDER